MTLEAFLAQHALAFGFGYGVRTTAAVAAQLETDGCGFVDRVLTAPEIDAFGRLQVPKRRIEWLAGRLAAKAAFSHYRQPRAPDGQVISPGHQQAIPGAAVLSRPNRAPFIAGYPDLCLSISHSGAYAVAVVATFPIGVDIEVIEPRPALFAEYFLCQREREMLPAAADSHLTWLWSRKEAVAKFLQVGGAIPFSRIDVSGNMAEVIGKGSFADIRLVSGRYDGYWISLAL